MKALQQSPESSAAVQDFATQLLEIASLHSTHNETQAITVSRRCSLAVVCPTSPALHDATHLEQLMMMSQAICTPIVAQSSQGEDSRVFDLLADLLFLKNSSPFHKQLLSCLQRLQPERASAWADAVTEKVMIMRRN